MYMLKLTNQKIIKEATFPISREEMWRKWTTHEGLLEFFGRESDRTKIAVSVKFSLM